MSALAQSHRTGIAASAEQEVTDAEGRRRFHGAFTGGYSAGYYNTVGSAEGWAPSAFTSSRDSRAAAKCGNAAACAALACVTLPASTSTLRKLLARPLHSGGRCCVGCTCNHWTEKDSSAT